MLFLNMFDFLSSVDNKRRYFEEIIVHTMKVNGVQNKLWTIHFLSIDKKKEKRSSFVFYRRYKVQQVWIDMIVSK